MMELARVVAIHPEDHSMDCIILRTGQRCTGVSLMASSASTTSGSSDMPPVNAPEGDGRFNVPQRTDQDALVYLMPMRSNWVAVGYQFPQVNAVLNAEPGRKVYRHSSGAWHMIAPDGTVTIGHPSGAVAVMGPNLTPTDPVGGDVDGRWAHSGPAAAAQVGLHMAFPSGAAITLGTDGKLTIKAIAEATIDVPLTKLTGALEVAGGITSGGTIAATGNVTAGSVSLQTHTHSGVQGGSGSSGGPV